MPLARLARYRRSLRWGSFLLFLTLIAVGLYFLLPAEPRWTIADEPRVVLLANDQILVTYSRDDVWSGPVQIWDMATGRELARFLDGTTLQAIEKSKDGRRLVAVEKADLKRIHTIDLDSLTQKAIDVPLELIDSVQVSPDGSRLAARKGPLPGWDTHYAIVELADGR